MAKVKGYFNTINGVFLGPMTVTNDDGSASTPRYIEGVCFGEYDTQTDKFVPETNPMHIPKGMIFTQDEQINEQGKLVNIRTGMEEDKGADFVSKGAVSILYRTPNVETRDEKGKLYKDRPVRQNPVQKEEKPKLIVPGKPKVEKVEVEGIDLDNLF